MENMNTMHLHSKPSTMNASISQEPARTVQLVINIPEPCSVDFDSMPKSEHGIACDLCEREVHDFRGKAPQFIYDAFVASNGSICGIYDTPKQETRAVVENYTPNYAFTDWKFLKKFALALFLVFGLQLFAADAFAASELEQFRTSVLLLMDEPTGDVKIITGKIIDYATNESLPGATVAVWSDSTIVTGVVADLDGNFKLELDEKEWKALRKGQLQVRFMGYLQYEMEGSTFEGQKHHMRTVKMKMDAPCLCKEVVITQGFFDFAVDGGFNSRYETTGGVPVDFSVQDIEMIKPINGVVYDDNNTNRAVRITIDDN